MTRAEGRHVVGIDASRVRAAQRTGTENYSYRIIEALLAQEVPWNWRLYANDPDGEMPFGIPAHAGVRAIPAPRMWTHYRLSREMLAKRPDALFVPSHVVPLIHPRTVVTIHDLGYLTVPEAHPAMQRRMLDITTRWSVHAAREIIVPSSRTRDDLIRHYGVPAAKITVIHHGVDPRFLTPPPDPTAFMRSRHLERPYVLAVGTIQPRKNLAALAKAMKAATDEHDLVVAGKRGWMADEVLAELHAAGLGERLRLLDYVPDDDLPALYAGATLFAQPSRFEGFGMPVLEAMATGVPVIAASGSSLEEVAGDAAVFFDPNTTGALAHELRGALGDDQVRRELAMRGHARARRFTWTRAAAETRTILGKTLA